MLRTLTILLTAFSLMHPLLLPQAAFAGEGVEICALEEPCCSNCDAGSPGEQSHRDEGGACENCAQAYGSPHFLLAVEVQKNLLSSRQKVFPDGEILLHDSPVPRGIFHPPASGA